MAPHAPAAGLLALALLTACSAEPAPTRTDGAGGAPDTAPAAPEDGGTDAGTPLPAVEAPSAWPTLAPADAWVPVLDAVQALADLPPVPTDHASASQAAALADARNLTRRLSLDRTRIDLLLRLANLYATSLFPDRAMAVLGLCLEVDREDLTTLKLVAASLSAAGRFEDAMAVLEHVGRAHPDAHSLAGPLFSVYWELGELDAARAALDRGLELNPHSPHLALRLGQVLFEESEAEAAEVQLRRAAQGLPSSTEAWHRWASCLEELGRTEEAGPARERHALLDQMVEFGIPGPLPWPERLARLAAALDETGDPEGAARARRVLADA